MDFTLRQCLSWKKQIEINPKTGKKFSNVNDIINLSRSCIENEVHIDMEYKDPNYFENDIEKKILELYNMSDDKLGKWIKAQGDTFPYESIQEFACKHGYIWIDSFTMFGINNSNIEYQLELGDKKKDEYKISLWKSCMLPGIYKFRDLHEGFELSYIGKHFISSQQGPCASYKDFEDSQWHQSFMSRGFQVDITPAVGCSQSNCFKHGNYNYPTDERSTLNVPKRFWNSANFFILYDDDYLIQDSDTFAEIEIKSKDTISQLKDKKANTKKTQLLEIKNKEGHITGFVINKEIFSAYDLLGRPKSDEGQYWFYFTWWRYKRLFIGMATGFIITGSQNTYEALRDYDYNSDDEEIESSTNVDKDKNAHMFIFKKPGI